MPLPPRPPLPPRRPRSIHLARSHDNPDPSALPTSPDPRRRGSLADALTYADDVYRVARLAIEVTVRSLERMTGRRYAHQRAWDHASRPGRHFLESPFGCLDRAWVAYLPLHAAVAPGALGVLFHLHLLDAGGRIEPALMVGSLDPGRGGFGAIQPQAAVRCIQDVEASRPGFVLHRRGPLAVVTSDVPGELAQVVLFRVPLDHLASYRHLVHAVVHPLAALLAGDLDLAEGLLEDVTTLGWPVARSDGVRAA